jgi:hypothetical protein
MGEGVITLRMSHAGAAMKIPVGETLEAAFGFAFTRFLSVLGTMWFPVLIGVAIVGGAAFATLSGFHAVFVDAKADPMAALHAMVHLSGLISAFWVVFLVIGAMIQVGLLRKALGLHPGPVFVYFSLGAEVWRLVGATLLLWLIFIGMAAAGVVAGLVVFGLSQSFVPAPGRYWIDGIAFFALGCAYLYAFVRISYFVPVVVVAEGHIGIGRAWELAGGNFWRIVAIVLVIVIAVNVVASMLSAIFMPPFATMMTWGIHTDPADLLRHYMTHLTAASPVLVLIYLLQNVLLYGLLAGASANAYRALAPADPTAAAPQGMHPA